MQAEREKATRTLRSVLQINAGFSLGSGLLLAVAARPLAVAIAPDTLSVAGMSLWGVVMAIGVGVVLFALEVLRVAAHHPLPLGAAWRICIADDIWVVGSIALLLVAAPRLSAMGVWLVLSVGTAVGAFAALEFRGLRRLGTSAASERQSAGTPTGS